MFRALLFIRGGVVALVLALAAASVLQAQEMVEAPLVVQTDEGRFEYSVELALTPRQRSVGLMNRESMEADHGMLFQFDTSRPVTMWMKNTLIPLDMIFIRNDGTVAGFHADAEPLSLATIASPEPVRYVLELNAGEAAEMGLAEGDTVSHPLIEAGAED